MASDERKFSPTTRRLKAARHGGDLPVSRRAVALGAGSATIVALGLGGAGAWQQLQNLVRDAIAQPPSTSSWTRLGPSVWELAGPIVACAGLSALTIGLLQTRGQFRLGIGGCPSPAAKPSALSQLCLICTILLGVLLAWIALQPTGQALATSTGDLSLVVHWLVRQGSMLARIFLAVALVIASVDIGWSQYKWRRRHRMTRGELEQEQKLSQADPTLKRARSSAHLSQLEDFDLNKLHQATIVVAGPQWLAIALSYDRSEDFAPRVLLQGAGATGALLLAEAEKSNVPVHHDALLATELSALAPSTTIPESTFERVSVAMSSRPSDPLLP